MTPAEKVYRQYRDDPDGGKRSYLHDHYRRGLAGIMEPSKKAKLAHAAWRAGQDKTEADRPKADQTTGLQPGRLLGCR